MSHVIKTSLLFHGSRLFISVYFMHSWPNISNVEGKVIILLSKFFQRLLNSFDAIFRWETSTTLQGKSQKGISRHSATRLPFIVGSIHCLWLMIKHFLLSFHSAELAGNFVFCSLEVSLRIISFSCLFRLPVWNFGGPRVNCRHLCPRGAC